MPSVTQEERPVVPSSLKKRRRDDQDEDMQAHLHQHRYHSPAHLASIQSDGAPLYYHPHHTYHAQQGMSPRKILPTSKKLRLVEDHQERHSYQPQSQQAHRSRTPDTTALQHTTANSRPQLVARSSTTTTTSAALLRPCHICHRKPTKKSDLDSFADCEGCEQRTCYVCMRKCLGWRRAVDQQDNDDDGQQQASRSFHMEDAPPPHSPPPDENEQAPQQRQHQHKEKPGWAGGRGGGHRQMVCSRCCVERGRDGDVVCLGCLPFVEA